MKKAKKLKGAEALGFKVTIDKSMDKYSKQVLFPKKVEEANKIISKLKMD